MKGFAKKGNRGEKGFTLVELLVVFTLMGILAAIMIPNVSGLINFAQTEAPDAELSIIQTAMDTMMAKDNLIGVTAVTAGEATSNMSNFPTGAPLYPDYVRFEISSGNYTCDASGEVARTIYTFD